MTGLMSTSEATFSGSQGLRRRPNLPISRSDSEDHDNAEIRREVIDLLEDDDEHIDERIKTSLSRYVDLTAINDDDSEDESGPRIFQPTVSNTSRRARGTGLRLELANNWEEIKNFGHNGEPLRKGATVELIQTDDDIDRPQFLLISKVLRNEATHEIHLSGFALRRINGLRYFERRLNDLYIDIEENAEDDRHYYKQGEIKVPIDHCFRLRDVVFTDQAWPSFSPSIKIPSDYEKGSLQWARCKRQLREQLHDEGQLVCRFVIIRRYANATLQKKNKMDQTELRRLYEDENPLIPPSDWKLKSRPTPTPTHSHSGQPRTRTLYTYGSGFCGCGGDSQGAKLAGFSVKFAFDEWDAACEAFQLNHPQANVYNLQVHDVCQLDDGAVEKVVHLHLSPPCQPFSRQLVRPGPNYDAQIATMFGVGEILKKMAPRTISLEETYDLLGRHGVFFGLLVEMIVSAGYNLRWKVAKFDQYGLPSSRNRLVIFGARPGEALPKFPAITHGPGFGLQRYNYIHDAISTIPRNADLHLGSTAKVYDPPLPTYNARTTRAPCVTCGGVAGKAGTRFVHPDGERQLTARELGTLNGFSHDYKIQRGESATNAKKMFGNAVPPSVWKTFMALIKRTLTDFDDGRINEAGLPVAPARSVSPPLIEHVRSIRPLHRSAPTLMPQSLRNRASAATPVHRFSSSSLPRVRSDNHSSSGEESATRQKRKQTFNLDDSEDSDELEISHVRKKTAALTIDLTSEEDD